MSITQFTAGLVRLCFIEMNVKYHVILLCLHLTVLFQPLADVIKTNNPEIKLFIIKMTIKQFISIDNFDLLFIMCMFIV